MYITVIIIFIFIISMPVLLLLLLLLLLSLSLLVSLPHLLPFVLWLLKITFLRFRSSHRGMVRNIFS